MNFRFRSSLPPFRSPSGIRRRIGAVMGLIVVAALVGRTSAAIKTATPFEDAAPIQPANRIDELVFARLPQLEISPAPLCSDAVFLRRACLDVIGTLPTPAEVRAFLADTSPDKRARLIDRLLARDEFADYWAMKWSDLLRVKAEFPINLWPNAAQCYHRWLDEALRSNLPYDRFVRELLTATGSNFRNGPVNFYRALQSKEPAAIARTVALTFMGMRTERWPEARQAELAVFFSRLGYKGTGEWKEEIVFFDFMKPAAAATGAAVLPDGTSVAIPSDRDPRMVFADWLIDARNPYFTRPIANRVWSWLLGRGIVQEPDDFRPDNPASNPALLDHLTTVLVESGFDLKSLFRAILNSRTYQLSSIPAGDNAETAAANFACYPLRRLDAEVLIDAINQVTGTHDSYSSAIPEPFTYIPPEQRAISLPDGSITSSFLEMFGRPGRDTGLESERNNTVSATQRLHLLNSSHIQRKIESGPKIQSVLRGPEPLVNLYLAILSRPPTQEERRTAADYIAQQRNPRRASGDIAWALINSPEFLYRH